MLFPQSKGKQAYEMPEVPETVLKMTKLRFKAICILDF